MKHMATTPVLLVILDGSKALRKAVRATVGDAALVQRCQVHKMPNILVYLNDRQRPWAQAMLRRAYQSADVKTAQRLLVDLAKRLETEYPSAAESVREGPDETLTVLTLNLPGRLRRSLATNCSPGPSCFSMKAIIRALATSITKSRSARWSGLRAQFWRASGSG